MPTSVSSTHMEFMGHILLSHGIGMAKTKIDAILNARRPETVSEVWNFLGLVNISGRFILNLATTAEPLKKLTRNNVQFKWEYEQTKAFEELKKHLAQPETLGYFDPSAQTIVVTDASPVGPGGVLVQTQSSEYRDIMYASRRLSDVKRRYSQRRRYWESSGNVKGFICIS